MKKPGNVKNPFGARAPLLLVGGLALLAALFLLVQGLQPCDDAYITFRHAKNFALHFTPSWNLEGGPVMGSTTPAYLFALGLFAVIIGAEHIESIALALNAVLLFLIVIMAYLAAMDLLKWRSAAFLAAALIGFNSINILLFSFGFENALLTAILLAGLIWVRKGHDIAALLAASAAPLVRPEGILLIPLVFGTILFAKRFRIRHLAYLSAVPLLWLLFSVGYYGSPLPQPLHTKKKFPAIYQPYKAEEVDLAERLTGLPGHIAAFWSERAGPILFTGSYESRKPSSFQRAARWIALLGLPFLLASVLLRRDGRWIYALYAPLFLALYAWIGYTELWYFPSYITFSILMLFTGWGFGLKEITKRLGHGRWRVGEAAIIPVFLLFATFNNYALNEGREADDSKAFLYAGDPRGNIWRMWERNRLISYRKAAEFLNGRKRGRQTTLISEVGVFGYFYNGPGIDSVGICSPEALAFYPPPESDIYDASGRYRHPINNFVPTDLVMSLKPGYVVDSQVYILQLLNGETHFLDEYTPIHQPGHAWGAPIMIYERRATGD